MTTAFLPYPEGCIRAEFIERRKRFTVNAKRADGPVAAHTNNTGSMMGLLREGRTILLSPAANPARKLKWTLEAIEFDDFWVGVNTSTPNRMVRAAFEAGQLPDTEGYTTFRSEAKTGNSRLDARIEGPRGVLWVECKNVTMVEDCRACFPDAATERGRKHLHELMTLAERGDRVALFFLVQRPDGDCFGPADFIDPEYADLLAKALDKGVEAWPFEAEVSMDGIRLGRRLPVAI